MRRDDAINRLQHGRDRLTRLGAGRLFLYGSVARDEATSASDVDLLVDPLDTDFSIFTLGQLQVACADILPWALSVRRRRSISLGPYFLSN